jgi:WD40 repeat protein
LVTAGAKICATERFGDRMLAGSEAGDWFFFEPTEQKLMSSGRLANTVAVSSLSGSLAGDRVAVGNIDGEVYLLSLGSSETLGSWVVGEGEVTAMAWIDQQTLVTASRSGAVIVWTLGDGLPHRYATLLRSESPVVQMDYCPESQTLLMRQEDRYGLGLFSWRHIQQAIEEAGIRED